MKSIEERIASKLESRRTWFKHIKDNIENLKGMSLNFRFLEDDLVVEKIKNGKYQDAKQHFYVAALIDELRVAKYNVDLFSYDLPAVCSPVLSDNETLIQRYAQLRYHTWGKMPDMDANVLNGKSDIWCNTVQFFMANDRKGVEKNLNIIEIKTLPNLPKKEENLKDDYEFYKALHASDKAKMEEVLEKLVSPKVHRKRNDNPISSQYISLPALGYAKLAWRKGVKVEVNNQLIPKELLPIQPLYRYENCYDFLKDNS